MIHGEVDLADALDLDAAVGDRAAHLKDLGCTESLDVRRAMAVGELARHQLALDLDTGDARVIRQPAANRSKPKRPVTLLTCTCTSPRSRAPAGSGGWRTPAARSPSTRSGTWCGHPDAQVTVKPVIDLADHVHVEAYEVPDRIAEPVALRDVTLRVPLVHPPRPPAPAR